MSKTNRIATRFTGVFFRESMTNGKKDKTYYIRLKDKNNKNIEHKIGKYSEGIRENYAHQKRIEFVNEIRLGNLPPTLQKKRHKTIKNICDLGEKYFTYRKQTRSTQTDKSMYRKYIIKFFERYDMENIKRDDICKFKIFLLEYKNYIKSQDLYKQLSSKSVNNILNLYKAIIRFSIKHDLIIFDSSIYIELESIDNSRDRFLTKQEIQRLYDASKYDQQLFLIYKLALNTGARLGSIMSLCKKHINFTQMLLTLKDTKNNSTYTAFLTNELHQLLKEYTEGLNFNDLLFPTNPQRRLRSLLDDLFNQELDSEDRKNKIVFHSLRHTFASHLAINGTPIYTIQKLMNHKDIKMTQRYAKLSPDSGKDAVLGLNL